MYWEYVVIVTYIAIYFSHLLKNCASVEVNEYIYLFINHVKKDAIYDI